MGIPYLILFLLFPIATLPLWIGLSLCRRFNNTAFMFYISLALGLMGYAYVPSVTKDIYTHYLTIQEMSMHGSAELFAKIHEIGGPAFFYFIEYICGTLNIFNLLPLFVVTASYYMYFLGLRETLRNEKSATINILALLWIFATLSYPFIMTNLRQPFAVACIFYVVTKPRINKVTVAILLFSALLFHVTGALMIACLGLAYLWDLRRFKSLTFGIVITAVFIVTLNIFGYDLRVADKVELYLGKDAAGRIAFEDFWRYVALSFLNAITFVVLAAQIFFTRSYRLKHNPRLTEVLRRPFNNRFPDTTEEQCSSRNMPMKQYYFSPAQLSSKYAVILFGVSMLFVNNLIVFQRLMFYLPLFSASMVVGFLDKNKRYSMGYCLTLGLLLLSTTYAIRLQWANYGGYEYWPGVYYRDLFSILYNAKNYCLLNL